jgi:hypothetical protein
MRLGPFALSAVLPAFLGLSTTMMVLGSGDGVTANRLLVQGSLAEHKLETLPNEAERQAARRAIRTAQAHAFATLQSVAADESQGLQRNVAIGFLTAQSPSSREELESALSEYPNPTAEELAAARRRLDALAPPYRLASLLPRIALVVLSLFAIPALLLALVARGAPLLALFGIAVQTVEGGRASRLRCLLRSLLIWGPFVLYHFWQPWPILIVVFPLTVATGMAFALARPASGLPDWLVGTRLVPR